MDRTFSPFNEPLTDVSLEVDSKIGRWLLNLIPSDLIVVMMTRRNMFAIVIVMSWCWWWLMKMILWGEGERLVGHVFCNFFSFSLGLMYGVSVWVLPSKRAYEWEWAMIYLSEKETNETIYFMIENLLTSSTPMVLDFDLDICETFVKHLLYLL